MRIQDSVAKVFNSGIRGTFQNGVGKPENTRSDLETISQGNQSEQVYGTNLNSLSRSSTASLSVSMIECSRATRQRRTASSRSVRSETLSRKLEKSIVARPGDPDHNQRFMRELRRV